MKKAAFIILCSLLFTTPVYPENVGATQKGLKIMRADRGADAILPDGKYRFDIAFAEWRGESMGEKVTVVINGGLIEIIYEGDGQLSAAKGEVIDRGTIMKHKSGVWIIGQEPSDVELDEIGGCTGGPAIIDFKNRKYWMC